MNSEKHWKKREVLKVTGKILEKKNFTNLCGQKSIDKKNCIFRKYMSSNFYIGNSIAPLSNSIKRFGIRVRNDILHTSTVKARIFESANHIFCRWNNYRMCHVLHIFNHCDFSMIPMTTRRNIVQEKIVKAVKKSTWNLLMINLEIIKLPILTNLKDFDVLIYTI
jgi:hypothetical protein